MKFPAKTLKYCQFQGSFELNLKKPIWRYTFDFNWSTLNTAFKLDILKVGQLVGPTERSIVVGKPEHYYLLGPVRGPTSMLHCWNVAVACGIPVRVKEHLFLVPGCQERLLMGLSLSRYGLLHVLAVSVGMVVGTKDGLPSCCRQPFLSTVPL